MHKSLPLCLLFLTLVVSSCSTTHRIIDATYQHEESGVAFPITVGDFKRDAILQSEDGAVGAEYSNPHEPVSATVYIYPAVAVSDPGAPPGTFSASGRLLIHNDFERYKNSLLHSHPGTQIIMEAHVANTTWGYPHNGTIAWFEYRDNCNDQTYKQELLVYPYVFDKWAIRYIFTYPKESRSASVHIAAFSKGVPQNVPSQYGNSMPSKTPGSELKRD